MVSRELLRELDSVLLRVIRKKVTEWNKTPQPEISSTQSLILERLDACGVQKAAELAYALDITPGTLTPLCDKLATAGYIKRERADEDRRIVHIALTSEGSELLRRIRAHREALVERMYGNLDEADLRQLIRIYSQVYENLSE